MEKIDTAIPLRLDAVAKSYRGQGGVKPLSLSLTGGRITALLGPNGAGKSTAMRLMNGLQRPDCGTVRLWGRSPRSMAARQRLGVMLQSAALPQHLTVAELVRLVASYYPAPLALGEIRRLAHLDAIWRQRYQALSGGQQRLVQFAQAISGRPDLLLLDEPSVGLDMTARQHMWAIVRHLADQGCAVLLATHHLEEAEAMADDVIVLCQGAMLINAPLPDLRQRVARVEIRCRSVLAADEVASWDHVSACRRRGGHLELRVNAPETVVAALLATDPDLTQLEVRRPGLGDIFAEALNEVTSSTGEAA
ncbi:ABC transporter ATP-binding protein [Frateuria aurantia]